MSYELRIALRYLVGRRKQTSIAVVTGIAVAGIGLGVAALIVVTAVMSGFLAEVRDRILGSNSHIVVFDRADQPIRNYRALVDVAEEVRGVHGASAFILSKAMVRAKQRRPAIVILKGIDPDRTDKVLKLSRDLQSGRVSDLREFRTGSDGQPIYRLLLGKSLAESLEAKPGMELELLIPGTGDEEDAPDAVSRTFEVAGIFESRMHEYDSKWVYLSLSAAQDFLRLGDEASGLEISVEDIWNVEPILNELETAMGSRYWMQDWQTMNGPFFKAIEQQKLGMFVVLCLIVLVAAFNVISTLVLMVMERGREVGILKALGANERDIYRIFLFEGMVIGLLGTVLGLVVGCTLSVIADRFQLVRVSGEIYWVSYLPFHLQVEDITTICGVSLLISFLTTIFPAYRAARLNPVEAIHYE